MPQNGTALQASFAYSSFFRNWPFVDRLQQLYGGETSTDGRLEDDGHCYGTTLRDLQSHLLGKSILLTQNMADT